MENQIIVSVVVPVYNTEKYIKRCVESILSQTFSDFEILLVDDGSTDASSFICDEFSSRDRRIKVIHQKGGGVCSARNTGILNAQGKYIAFLDSDDWWDEKFLKNMLKSQKPMDLSICKLCKVHPSGLIIPDKEYTCSMDEWCWPIVYNYSISCYRCLFLRNIVINHDIAFTIGRKTGEDQEFTYKYMMHISKINYVPDACYYYRLNPNSRMFKKNYEHFDAIKAMQSVEQYASLNCTDEKARIISSSLRNYKYPYLLEFGILTLLTDGESPKKLYRYLAENRYHVMLNHACHAFQHHDSNFMRLWKVSPWLCLRIFWIRKMVGKGLRTIKLIGKSGRRQSNYEEDSFC